MAHRPSHRTFPNWRGQYGHRAVFQEDSEEAVEYGKTYNTDYYSESVADDGTINVHIATCSSDKLKLGYKIVTGGDAIIEFIEAPTVTSNGTELDEYNLNRVDQTSSNTTIYKEASFNSDGTILEDQYIPGGTKQFSRGGEVVKRWIPQTDTSYIIKVTNKSGGSTFLGIEVIHEVQ